MKRTKMSTHEEADSQAAQRSQQQDSMLSHFLKWSSEYVKSSMILILQMTLVGAKKSGGSEKISERFWICFIRQTAKETQSWKKYTASGGRILKTTTKKSASSLNSNQMVKRVWDRPSVAERERTDSATSDGLPDSSPALVQVGQSAFSATLAAQEASEEHGLWDKGGLGSDPAHFLTSCVTLKTKVNLSHLHLLPWKTGNRSDSVGFLWPLGENTCIGHSAQDLAVVTAL